MQVDLRSTKVELITEAGADGTFYMDLSNLYTSLDDVTFAFKAYDGPDPDSNDEVEVTVTTVKDSLLVYVTIDGVQANMSFGKKYWFQFTATESGGATTGLCRGTVTRKGMA